MIKIDHRKTLAHLYHPSTKSPGIVDVPAMKFLMVEGTGKPDTLQFQQGAQALYPLAYTLKWMVRLNQDIDFHVMPMEVLWKVNRTKKEFNWTMMLMQPEFITPSMVDEARVKAASKADVDLLAKVRFEDYNEGLCVQYCYVGPYQGMDATADRMIAFAEDQGYQVPQRNTHDIYLNDARKTKPENLKSIMRFKVSEDRS